jgi:formamidopyrimidine-DNA glycosylase
MPELPDLVYMVEKLQTALPGKTITAVEVKEPIVIRMMVPGGFKEALTGQTFREVRRHGPFLCLVLDHREIVIHFMLAGSLELVRPSQRLKRDVCLSLRLTDQDLRYSDSKKMGKVYVTKNGNYTDIPGYLDQGVDISGENFTYEVFQELIKKERRQSRVFIMDHAKISALGNAYADEVLFEAKIHPKTFCSQLDSQEVQRLYESIKKTVRWAIEEVEKANQPLGVKARDHVRIRNRKGESCVRCDTIIRRTQVYGYDSFFCPKCQPLKRRQLVDWSLKPPDER